MESLSGQKLTPIQGFEGRVFNPTSSHRSCVSSRYGDGLVVGRGAAGSSVWTMKGVLGILPMRGHSPVPPSSSSSLPAMDNWLRPCSHLGCHFSPSGSPVAVGTQGTHRAACVHPTHRPLQGCDLPTTKLYLQYKFCISKLADTS